MTYPLFDSIVGMFYQVFGGGAIVALIILAVIILTLLSINAGRTVIVIAILPVIIIFATYHTTFISFPRWIGTILWVIIAFIAFFAMAKLLDT